MKQQATSGHDAQDAGKMARDYFERGCLCILSGALPRVDPVTPDWDAVSHYHLHCRCSRNYSD